MNAATSALLTKNRSHLGLRKMTTSFFVHREATRCKSVPTSFRGKSIIFGFQNISRVVCSFPSLFDITSFSSQVRKSCFISIGNSLPHFLLCECCDVILTKYLHVIRRSDVRIQASTVVKYLAPGLQYCCFMFGWLFKFLHHFKGQK